MCQAIICKIEPDRRLVRGLRERHRQEKGEQGTHPNRGDAVIIGSEEKNRNLWKLGIVEGLIRGRDGVVRGAKVKTVNGQLERAVQHLYPLELSCDREPPVSLNPTAPIPSTLDRDVTRQPQQPSVYNKKQKKIGDIYFNILLTNISVVYIGRS